MPNSRWRHRLVEKVPPIKMGNLLVSKETETNPTFVRAKELLKELHLRVYFPDPTEINYKVYFNFYDRNDGALEKTEVKKILREFLTIVKSYIEEDEELHNKLLKDNKIESPSGKPIKEEIVGILKKKKSLNAFITLGGFGAQQIGGITQFDRALDTQKSELIDILFSGSDALEFDVFVGIFEDVMEFPDDKRSRKVKFFTK
jgi:hypothetical protein